MHHRANKLITPFKARKPAIIKINRGGSIIEILRMSNIPAPMSNQPPISVKQIRALEKRRTAKIIKIIEGVPFVSKNQAAIKSIIPKKNTI